ncbi:senescence-associated protein AAF, chloroplastic isoform X2 [Physcomitrium patens]|uniref:Uncharacterized protein n=1 Tax=Physcomitrium patens TaxID=3218 RepID=A0A2K1KIY0_PHYPA|nr:senescence-associated protein AAF, chlorolplastic-like isoform X2 [Physcomitrium patens]PNR53723.1 hypothetical protein PHYPA_007398 [Physcomitrium patens]|eukprot:XP_024374900.1 senescence-associated protein AAF, chlorolplastic-like isoform X2 [Physcomitrella patens]
MSLSASTHLREACTQILMGAQGGSKDRKGKRNMVIGVGCRFEMKGDAKVDEKVCMMSDKKTVVPLPARNVGGPAEAARCAFNDAMLVRATVQNIDERARSDFHLLSRQILRLDRRVREDVALLGSGFLKLDARAREDVVKLDTNARQKMMRLRHIALGLTESASMELSNAAEEHWSDGALDADLRLVDLRARRRAMEDLYAALEVVKNVRDALVNTLRVRSNKPAQVDVGKVGVSEGAADDSQDFRSYLRKSNPMPDRLTAIQDACLKMASALVEAEGMECTDPDELEFIVAALLDMEEVDGGSGALLVTESASSPDVATRLALAGALADAPSLWTLGNAGMGALQRLSTDSNPEVAAAATKAINELKSQWRQPDHLTFPYSQ